MMIIDLSFPRLFIKDKIEEAIFYTRMKGYSLNRHHVATALAAGLMLGYNEQSFASQGSIMANDPLNQNIYPMIFALVETLKSCTLNDLKSIWMYLDNALLRGR